MTLQSAVRCLLAIAIVACANDHHPAGTPEPPFTVIDAAAGATNDTGDTGDTVGDAGGAPPAVVETSGQGGAPVDAPQATTDATAWSFDSDAELGAWQPEDGIEQSFGTDDADGSGDSGSLVVTAESVANDSDFVSNATSVCVPVEPAATYDVAVKVEIDTGQSPGSGGFDVEFLDGTGCDGALLDLADFLTATTGSWVPGEKTPVAPAGAHSALFRLVASKRASDPAFSVRFDDVRFEAQ